MNKRFELREQTSQAHIALESVIGPWVTMADYHRYLQGMHSFRLPLEAWLSRLTWPTVFGAWRPVMIGTALDTDIGDFGLQPRARKQEWPGGDDLDYVFGTLYVLEGSMLGSQLLLRRAKQLGLTENFGARHLAIQAGTPTNWPEFLKILEKSTDFDVVRATQAANRTFGAAQSAFVSE